MRHTASTSSELSQDWLQRLHGVCDTSSKHFHFLKDLYLFTHDYACTCLYIIRKGDEELLPICTICWTSLIFQAVHKNSRRQKQLLCRRKRLRNPEGSLVADYKTWDTSRGSLANSKEDGKNRSKKLWIKSGKNRWGSTPKGRGSD